MLLLPQGRVAPEVALRLVDGASVVVEAGSFLCRHISYGILGMAY